MRNTARYVKYVFLLHVILSSAVALAKEGNFDLEKSIALFERVLIDRNAARQLRGEMAKLSADDRKVLDDQLRASVEELGKSAPIQLDQHTTMDSVVLSGREFSYRLTLSDEIVELAPKVELMAELKEILKNNVCTTPQSGMLAIFGYRFNYWYYEKKGRYYSSVSLAAQDCGF